MSWLAPRLQRRLGLLPARATPCQGLQRPPGKVFGPLPTCPPPLQGSGSLPSSSSVPGRYLKQISELTFSQEAQRHKLNRLKAYNLEAEMHSLR